MVMGASHANGGNPSRFELQEAWYRLCEATAFQVWLGGNTLVRTISIPRNLARGFFLLSFHTLQLCRYVKSCHRKENR